MQTIITKYAGPTNTKGSRVIAKCWLKSKSFEWEYAGNTEENYKRAAVKLAEMLNDDRKKAGYDDYIWKVIASGKMPDNSGNAYIIDLVPNVLFEGVSNMRAIEKTMLQAINAKKNMQRDNTSVVYYPDTDTSGVFLYSHHIGTFIHISGTFRPDVETLKQWPTPTTKSRLRSLGVNVYTKAGKTYLNDEEI